MKHKRCKIKLQNISVIWQQILALANISPSCIHVPEARTYLMNIPGPATFSRIRLQYTYGLRILLVSLDLRCSPLDIGPDISRKLHQRSPGQGSAGTQSHIYANILIKPKILVNVCNRNKLRLTSSLWPWVSCME